MDLSDCNIYHILVYNYLKFMLFIYIWCSNKTVLLRDMVHQTPEGSQRPPGWPAAADYLSDGPYHITTQFYFHRVMSKLQYSRNI